MRASGPCSGAEAEEVEEEEDHRQARCHRRQHHRQGPNHLPLSLFFFCLFLIPFFLGCSFLHSSRLLISLPLPLLIRQRRPSHLVILSRGLLRAVGDSRCDLPPRRTGLRPRRPPRISHPGWPLR